VPIGSAERPNRKPTRVYVQGSNGAIREGTIVDICKGDDVVASVEVEGWWGSKDSSGFTYRIDECLVYKANQRPAGCSLRALNGDGPIIKRVRTDPADAEDTTTDITVTDEAPTTSSSSDSDAAAPVILDLGPETSAESASAAYPTITLPDLQPDTPEAADF